MFGMFNFNIFPFSVAAFLFIFYFSSTHTHRRRWREWVREISMLDQHKCPPSILHKHIHTHNASDCVLLCKNGEFAQVLVSATFTHRPTLSVLAQLQLTHCQRRTAFHPSRFACLTFFIYKAIDFPYNWDFPPANRDSEKTVKHYRWHKIFPSKEKQEKVNKNKSWKFPSDGWK